LVLRSCSQKGERWLGGEGMRFEVKGGGRNAKREIPNAKELITNTDTRGKCKMSKFKCQSQQYPNDKIQMSNDKYTDNELDSRTRNTVHGHGISRTRTRFTSTKLTNTDNGHESKCQISKFKCQRGKRAGGWRLEESRCCSAAVMPLVRCRLYHAVNSRSELCTKREDFEF
jgi:hypothetical protein